MVATAILLHTLEHSASVGSVQVDNPEASQTTTAQLPPVAVKTDYFSTLLPAGFAIKHQANISSEPFLLQLEANTSAVEDEQFAATVGTMPTDNLRGVGDYNLRITEPDTYAPVALDNLPSGAVAFRTTEGPAALTVFWPHNATYAELAFSTNGGATETQLETLFAQVLTHWQWVQ